MDTSRALHEERRHYLQKVIQQQAESETTDMRMQQEGQVQRQERQMPDFVARMQTEAAIERYAQPIPEREGWRARKKREERQNAWNELRSQSQSVEMKEREILEQRRQIISYDTMTAEQIEKEAALLRERIKEIDMSEKLQLSGDGVTELSEQDKLKIRWEAQDLRAKRLGEYARILPVGSSERKAAMAEKEQQELKANHLRKEYKITQITNETEQKRERNTLKRHDRYDKIKNIRGHKPSFLSHEDAVYIKDGLQLVNVGRAFFGGTKPMYIFEDRNAPIIRNGRHVGYKQYLYKEAINCVGGDTPDRALTTEAASKLQSYLCGAYSIPAFAVKDPATGVVVGSFQEKVDTYTGEDPVELFSWQAKVEARKERIEKNGEVPDEQQLAELELSESDKKEILREHALDWLLCNFDTKGENFLERKDRHLCSFDKEASFSELKERGAQHMSSTYKSHANDTLYNTIYTEYAEGRIELNLRDAVTQIEKMETLSDEAYMEYFKDMLDQKYGDENSSKRRQMEERMLARKTGLRAEYTRFFGELIDRRRAALEKMGRTDDTQGYRNREGKFQF